MRPTAKLTEAQFRTLTRVMALGGGLNVRLSMGRLTGRGNENRVNRVCAERLVELGLLEWVEVQDPARQKYAHRLDIPFATCSRGLFVTAAGCQAVNEHR